MAKIKETIKTLQLDKRKVAGRVKCDQDYKELEISKDFVLELCNDKRSKELDETSEVEHS